MIPESYSPKSLNLVYSRIPTWGIGETELASNCGLLLKDLRERLKVLVGQGKIEQCPDYPDHWRKIIKTIEEGEILQAIPQSGISEIELAMCVEGSVVEIRNFLTRLLKSNQIYQKGDLYYVSPSKTGTYFVVPQDSVQPVIEVEEVEPELTYSEQQELTRLERKVERAFYEAGKALAEIRDRKLYRDRYQTFEAYCKERFGLGKSRVYQQIAAAEVYEDLVEAILEPQNENDNHSSTNCGRFPLPTNEGQCRPLASLLPQHRTAIWKMAVEENGGRIPPERIVKQITKEFQQTISQNQNPWKVGDIVSLGGIWFVVLEVREFSCRCGSWKEEETYHYSELREITRDDQKEVYCQLRNRLFQLWNKSADINYHDRLTIRKIIDVIGKNLNNGNLTDFQSQLLDLLEIQFNDSGQGF